MGGVAPSAHFGAVVEAGPEVGAQFPGHRGPQDRKVPGRGVALEIESGPGLAERGVEAPAAIGEFVLIEGVGLGHYSGPAHFQGHGQAAAHSRLQGIRGLGSDIEAQGPGALFREGVHPDAGVSQGGRGGEDGPA